jgi:hypothetical protein
VIRTGVPVSRGTNRPVTAPLDATDSTKSRRFRLLSQRRQIDDVVLTGDEARTAGSMKHDLRPGVLGEGVSGDIGIVELVRLPDAVRVGIGERLAEIVVPVAVRIGIRFAQGVVPVPVRIVPPVGNRERPDAVDGIPGTRRPRSGNDGETRYQAENGK